MRRDGRICPSAGRSPASFPATLQPSARMTRDEKTKLAQAAACLVCAVVVWRYGSDLEGTEFSGGWLTGPLLDMKDVGTLLFVLALLLTFVYRRIATRSVLALFASLSLLYNSGAFPLGFQRRIFGTTASEFRLEQVEYCRHCCADNRRLPRHSWFAICRGSTTSGLGPSEHSRVRHGKPCGA